MKKIITVILIFTAIASRAQSRIKIMHDANSLSVNNGDTSYVFNAFIVSQPSTDVSSIRLIFKNYSGNNVFTTEKDTTYAWSQVNSLSNPVSRYGTYKVNGNIIKVCLGRFYWSTRQRFSIQLSGNNISFIKEYNF
jgi:hypothetical protein